MSSVNYLAGVNTENYDHHCTLHYITLRKVYIGYPAILKYVDVNGRNKIVGTEELAKLRREMEEEMS